MRIQHNRFSRGRLGSQTRLSSWSAAQPPSFKFTPLGGEAAMPAAVTGTGLRASPQTAGTWQGLGGGSSSTHPLEQAGWWQGWATRGLQTTS